MGESMIEYDPLDDGISYIRLVETGGDELSIVNAARVSLHNQSEWQTIDEPMEWNYDNEYVYKPNEFYLSDKDTGLIKFLLKNKHGSPFEHNFFAFHIRLPIFVMREWVRHRIGFSINEESGRYVEMRPDFFIPDHIRTQQGKPGAYTFEVSDNEFVTNQFTKRLADSSERCYYNYKWALVQGIAKEQARLFLPLNLYTECRWTANARSLMNFLALRNKPDAMREIHQYAEVLDEIFYEQMPNVHRAFVENGSVAP
jgi:thymidylate synthase (FAD)